MSAATPPEPVGEGEDLQAIEAAALAIAREAGNTLLERFARPQEVRYKSSRGRDPVTEADEALEAFARDAVRRRFPAHGFLGEEGGGRAAGAEFQWVVDPLDGTANFASGLPIFAHSIGVLRRGAPVAAALFTSFGPEGKPCVLHARLGGGLHIDGEPYVDRVTATRGRLVGVPAGFHRRFRRRRLKRMPPGETRSLGSTAAELGLVACGRLHYALFESPRIWDIAAGVLLVQEAGGSLYVTVSGRWQPFQAFAPRGRAGLRGWRGSLVAGRSEVVDEFMRALRLHPSPFERLERLVGPGVADVTERVARVAARGSSMALKVARVGARRAEPPSASG